MNLGAHLLIDALMVAGGLLLYDHVRSPDPAPATPSVAPPDATPASSPGPAVTCCLGDPWDPHADPAILERFRAYIDKVEQMQRAERTTEMARSQLDRLGLTLTPSSATP